MNIKDYIEAFEMMDDETIYEYVLDKGARTITPVSRNSENYVHGCQSDVWVTGREGAVGWEFFVDSSSFMVKGIGVIICDCINGLSTEELEELTWADFVPLVSFFSQQRKQGMQAIINKCKHLARR